VNSYNVEAILSARDSGFSSAFRQAETQVKKLETLSTSVTNKYSSAIGSITKKAFNLAAGATTAFAAYTVKAGSDFEAAMSQVSAISGATGDDLAALTELAKEMGATTKFSATESASALNYMAMAGWDTEQMLGGLPGVMSLAAASGEDLATVSDIVTDAMTAFGMKAEEAGHFADVLAKSASSSNTSVGMLGESFKYVAPMAGALGYSIEDTSHVLGLMANAGIKGSQAGTALRAGFNALIDPTNEAKAALDDLGVSMFDSQGEAVPLNDLMGQLRGSLKDLTTEQKTQALSSIFGQRAASALLPVIEASAEEYDGLADEINNATGAAEDMSKTMQDNLQGDFTIMKSALEGLSIQIYESLDMLRPLVQKATEWIGKLADTFEILTDTSKTASERLDHLIQRFRFLGPVLAVVGSIFFTAFALPKIAAVSSALGTAGTAMGNLAASGIRSAGEFAGRFAPVIGRGMTAGATALQRGTQLFATIWRLGMSAIAPAAILGVALAGLGLLNDRFGEQINSMVETAIERGPDIIMSLANSITEKLPDLMASGADLVMKFGLVIIENLPTLITAGTSIIVSLIEGATEALPGLISTAGGIISALLEGLIENLPRLFMAGIGFIIALAEGIAEQAPGLIGQFVQLLGTIVLTIVEALPDLAMAGIQLLLSLSTGLLEAVPLIIASIETVIMQLVQTIREKLPEMIITGMQILMNLIQGIVSLLPVLIESAAQLLLAFVMAIIESLPDILSMGVELVLSLVQGLLEAIPALFASAGEIILALVMGLIENIPTIIGSGVEIVLSLIVGIIKGIPELIKSGWELIKGLAKGLLEAIPQLLSQVWEGIKNGFKKVWSWLTGSSEEAADETVDNVKTIEEGIDNSQQALNATTEDHMEEYRGLVGAGTGDAADVAIENTGLLSEGVSTNLETMNVDTTGILDSLQGTSTTTFESMSAAASAETLHLAEDVNANMTGLATDYGANLADLEGVSLEGFSNLANTGITGTEDMTNQVTSQTGLMSESITQDFEEMNATVDASMEGMGESIATHFAGLAEKLNGNFIGLKGTVERNTNEIKDIFDTGLESATKGVESKFKTMKNKAGNQVAQLVNRVKSNMSQIVSAVQSAANQIERQGGDGFSNLSQSATRELQAMNRQISRQMDQIHSGVRTGITAITSTVDSAVSRIRSAIRTGLTAITGAVTVSLSNMVSSFGRGMSSMGAAVMGGMANIRSAVSSAMSQVLGLSRTAASGVISAFNIGNSLYTAGYNAGIGFHSGLARTSGSIINLARSMANSVTNTIRNALKVRSPSKILEGVGSFAGEGLVVGLAGMLKAVKETSLDLAEAITVGTETALSGSITTGLTISDERDAKPLELNLRIGDRLARVLVQDISDIQNTELELQEVFSV